jgi:hypothetical protein
MIGRLSYSHIDPHPECEAVFAGRTFDRHTETLLCVGMVSVCNGVVYPKGLASYGTSTLLTRLE